MEKTPLYDTSLSVEERAKWILSQMTVEEKLECFAGHPAVERLGLPAYRFGGEAAHGLQARSGQGEQYPPTNTTSFTQPIGMAASWDKDLIREAGDVTGTEARAMHNVYGPAAAGVTKWAPTVDMCRDPRWGRNEEDYGEDPYLTGKMAGAYIIGMQDEHNYDGSPLQPRQRGDRIRVGANLKHFYANNVEWRRCYDSFDISDKVKYDYELEPFRYCIEEAHAEGVMTAYNEINHVTGVINPEVQQILKDKWGMVHAVSDGGAFQQVVNFHHDFETHAETLAAAIRAGVDNMLDNPRVVGEAAKEAWERGLITEEDIDKSLMCMFRSRIRLGAFDEVDPYAGLGAEDIGSERASAVSKKMAEETNVLLKNDNQFLPLSKEDDVVLIGPMGDVWLQDWYAGNPMHRTTLKEGIEAELGRSIRFENGLNQIRLKHGDKYVGAQDCENPCLILVDSVEDAVVFEHTDWGCGCNFLYSPKHKKYVNFTMDGPLKLDSDSPFRWFVMESLIMIPAEGATQLPEAKNANRIAFDKYWDDKAGDIKLYGFGARPVDIVDGILCGRDLVEIKNIQDSKEGKNMGGKVDDEFEAATFTVEIVKDGLAAAKELAKSAKKVIVALGCNPVVNAKEEVDRSTIDMIPAQEELAEEIYGVNASTAVVLMTNYPYAINWMQEHVPAILMNATGSQDMGTGLASALFGTSTPAGRLSMTWYLGDEDLVDITDYDLINNPRTYRYFDKPVLYPFGYGLTYSSFEYKSLEVKKVGEDLQVSVAVTNTGDKVSDEVVQIYLQRVSPSETVHPIRRLVGFERLHAVKPGETKEVTMIVNPCDVAIYMESVGERIVEAGEYRIYAGTNCLDEAVNCCITL